MIIISPEWVQAIAAVLTLLVVVAIAFISRNTIKGLSKREEAYRVRPYLFFDFKAISVNDTILMDVANIGRGDAFDVIVKVQLVRRDPVTERDDVTKYLPPTPIKYKRIPVRLSGKQFDTGIPKKHLSPTNPGDLLVIGTMADENGELIKINTRRSFEDFSDKVPEWKE